MSVYVEVNTHLRPARYRQAMAVTRRRPGSPKGQPKPAKRQLDPNFPKRFKAAMANKPGTTVPALARRVLCTRAVLLKYLKPGASKTIEALLLFAIAKELGVSPAWLLTGDGNMAGARSLSPDEDRALNTFNQLGSRELRDHWISQGEDLRRLQPSLVPSNADPFNGTSTPPRGQTKKATTT